MCSPTGSTLDSSLGTVEKKGIRLRGLRDGAGRVYGWTAGGKVFLNRDAMNPETPVHEYTHLWDEMLMRENPELWERGKELMKRTPVWDEVIGDPNYADIRDDEDAVASEVHSRLTGARGAEILEEMIDSAGKDGPMATAEAVTLVGRIKAWLADMFKALRRTLGKWSGRELADLSAEDFAGLTLRDLAEGMNPRTEMRRGRVAEPNPMQRDGREVSISSHEIKKSAIKDKMQNDKILHLDEKLSPGSEVRLTETPDDRRNRTLFLRPTLLLPMAKICRMVESCISLINCPSVLSGP